MDDIQNQTQTPQQPCKYSRVNSNGRIHSSKIAPKGAAEGVAINGGTHNNEVVGPTTTALATTSAARAMTGGGGVGGGLLGGEMVVGSNGTNNRFGRQWQHSSRIIRVSRASGGKDRHSKVWTAKGPRDRRVRLSVTTAIQFYDLQDRLGYDQPSKAVEWLIKAASEAINELPSLNTASFPPETPRQLSDERKSGGGVNNGVVDDSGDLELLDGEVNLGQNHQQQMGSKSGCSSNNSETSKGSGLSLSRSEIRVKARERARERTAKEKERDGEPSSSMVNVVASHLHNNQQQQHQQNVSSMAQTSSFTQLLTAGMTNLNDSNNGGGASSSPSAKMGLFHKHSRASGGGSNNNNSNTNNNQWLSSATSTTQMADYFGNGLMGLSSSSRAGHIGLGSNTSSLPQVMTIASFGGGSENYHQSHHDQLQHHNPHHHHTHHHSQQPHFPFMSDQHLIQVANVASGANGGGGGGGGNDYNLNFSMSSTSTTSSALAAAGYNNRGTLQSNSPSLLPYLQRFSAATDGSSLPFFLGSAAVSSASPNVENHHHHQQQQFQPTGLQLCYGDGGRQKDQKGKGKD